MKYTKFKDIPQFTRDASYHVNMDIRRVSIWIEENIIHALLRVQPSFPCLYFPCCSPADQSLSDRNMYHNGVFRLWFRICRTDLVHDAADCSWQTSDVTLCICFGNHESGSYASGNDQRLF